MIQILKKVSFLLLFSLCLISLIASCSSDFSEDRNSSIAGSVSDATTGEPVATVNVTLSPGGDATVTGSDGSFNFQNLNPGTYTIKISKEGYKPNEATFEVKSGNPTQAHLLIERIPTTVTADRETLDFGDNKSLNTLSFNIVNSSYEDLEWEIEERCEWITEIKPAKGQLAYGKTEGIVVVIDRNQLQPGTNKAVIVIRTSKGSSQLNVLAYDGKLSNTRLNVLSSTNITSSSATLNAEITDNGEPPYTERGFVYSQNPMPTLENSITKITCPVNSNKAYSYNLTNLKYGQKYYVRAYAKNDFATFYSTNEISFTTTPPLPVVKTLEVVNPSLKEGTATFRGEILSVGEPAYTERGFVYGEFENPTVNDKKIKANGSGEKGTFSVYVSNLPQKIYYVRAYATNKDGTSYGEQLCVSDQWIEIPEAGIAVQTQDIGKGDWLTIAEACEMSRLGGYNDWRLPTKEELVVLYNKRKEIGGFDDLYLTLYWSSSEAYETANEFYFYVFSFTFNEIGISNYDASCNGRAVRTLK